ncbi:MAG TPA: adenylate/guanylate cyclase domain-containing protein [Candidatus Binataceae bacterium]|nr:adenylate/guanylate cyclase domain-containing protein [Candidatus Binataceae bacterium]
MTDETALPDGERKTVSALFADIKGSMDLMEDIDPEQARALIDPALRIMIDAVHRYDGYIVQSTGDGVFALFGAPVAHEDHPHRALLAALKMQDDMRRYASRLREGGNSPIEVRIGVNTGEAVVRTIKTADAHTEYTPIGHATSLAARMQALAPTGSIAITENTRRFVEGYFELKPLGPTRVKGLSDLINVYEVTGVGPLRTRLQASARRGLSKFVGRDHEMTQLHRALELVRAGHGQIVGAVGEAGVGKSRLFHEFKIISHADCAILETFSVSHGKASAYMPLIDLLKSYFEIASEDDERKRREKIGGKVLMLDRTLEDALPYLFALLGVAESGALEEMDANIRRRRTLDAIKRLLLRESLNQPLIAMFEDLHWVDSETQAFLNLLADSIGTARILMMVNYRPEYRHEWSARSHYVQLRLDPLGRESADSLLTTMLGSAPELDPLKQMVAERTEGNPFFIEETVQSMFESGALVRNGKVSLAQPLSSIKIPASVKSILAARIDRLSIQEKDLLQTLSIIGKEFPLGLVRRVVERDEDALLPMLSALQLGEFVFEQPAFPDIEYVFKHALTQEVAYDSVLTDRRKLIHEKTALALESMYAPPQIEEHLPELAFHFSRSANVEKAFDYLFRAGVQARANSAYSEAVDTLRHAREMLRLMPEDALRDAREIRILVMLGQAIASMRGYLDLELMHMAGRLETLSERVTDPEARYMALFARWNIAFSRGNPRGAQEIAERMIAMVSEANDNRLASALQLLGVAQIWRGHPAPARESFERAVSIFNRDLDKSLYSPVDPVIPNRAHLAWANWMCGYPDRAMQSADEAVALALRLNRPFSIAFALQYKVSTDHLCRTYTDTVRVAQNLVSLARENGFPMWVACGTISIGRFMLYGHHAERGLYDDAERGVHSDAERGLQMMRDALTQIREAGGELLLQFMRVLFAESCLEMKLAEEGIAALDQAFEAIGQFDTRMLEPEIHRLRGEFHRLAQDDKSAEQQFREALRIAQEQGAKSWELRASTSLAKLMKSQGRDTDARAILEPIYNWFTEGFSTGDLTEAKALLDMVSVGGT